MLKDIKNNPNNKKILLITDDIQYYKRQLNKYDITNYRMEIIQLERHFSLFLQLVIMLLMILKPNKLELILF